jgi:hypothetical protein
MDPRSFPASSTFVFGRATASASRLPVAVDGAYADVAATLRSDEVWWMHTIKSIGVLSVAKIVGAMYGAMGLLLMPFFLLMGVVGPWLPNQNGRNPFGLMFGLVLGLFAPVVYGVMGFVFGALGAFVYNLMAKWIGGIEVQVQPSNPQPSAN